MTGVGLPAACVGSRAGGKSLGVITLDLNKSIGPQDAGGQSLDNLTPQALHASRFVLQNSRLTLPMLSEGCCGLGAGGQWLVCWERCCGLGVWGKGDFPLGGTNYEDLRKTKDSNRRQWDLQLRAVAMGLKSHE